MKPLEYYANREQTYLKHFFLERYLERVGFNICSFKDDFVYVDGFSGPWKSTDEKFEDTSFMIAIQKLRKVREGVANIGRKPPNIRCLFVEKDLNRYRELTSAIADVNDIDIKLIHGEFENAIPEIIEFIGNSFSLVFIDPTGWTGFGLERIAPLLKHRPGEVIVNFMFDYINRNFGVSFDSLFGGPGWKSDLSENQTIQLYSERMRIAGQFDHVTSTRILKATKDRTYFYLVYGTRHWKGLFEFRHVEQKFIEEQERVRLTAKQSSRITRTGQTELFSAAEHTSDTNSYDREKESQLSLALGRLRSLLASQSQLFYEDVLSALLEMPLVWESDVNVMVLALRGKELDIEGFQGRERRLKPGHLIKRR